METPISIKISDLPQDLEIEVAALSEGSDLEPLKSSLRSQILYNSRFEEESSPEKGIQVTVLSRTASAIRVRVEQ